jgi:hypothetical protein
MAVKERQRHPPSHGRRDLVTPYFEVSLEPDSLAYEARFTVTNAER